MTTPSGEAPKDALQFDAAEPAAATATPAAGVTCASCQRPITTTYYMLNESILCGSCRGRLERELNGGTGIGRFSGALLWGLGGAALGALVYYAVLAATGYEVGLIAIAVGWLVGRGVQRGSNGRGGPAYQAIAVVLTYFAIVSTYIPIIIGAAREGANAATSDSAYAESALLVDSLKASAPAGADALLAAEGASSAGSQPTFFDAVKAIGALLVFAAIVPFLSGIQNIIGLLIIGFALYQAWKMNKRVPIAFTGPFKVGAAPA